MYRSMATVGIAISLWNAFVGTAWAGHDVSIAATPVVSPVLLAGSNRFEAAAAVTQGAGCGVPHLIVRAREQDAWWDLPLKAGGVAKTRLLSFPHTITADAPGKPGYVVQGSVVQATGNGYVGGYDNTAATVPDGSALVQMSGATWNADITPKPGWWSTDIPGVAPSKYREATPGIRGFETFWKVSGCAPDGAGAESPTWTVAGSMDAALAGAVDTNGAQQASDYCALNPGGVADWDRPEIYADPFKAGRIFISLACARKTSAADWLETEVIYRSDDGGAGWTPAIGVPHALFYSLATTPSSGDTVWMLGGRQLYRSFHGDNFLEIHDLSMGGWDVSARPVAGTTRVNADNPSVGSPHVLARLGADSLVAAYPIDDPQGAGIAYQLRLITGAGGPNSPAPKIQFLPGTPVLEPQTAGGSILNLALIPDQRPTGAGAVVAYWIESDPPGAPDAAGRYHFQMHARFAVISPYTHKIIESHDTADWAHDYDPALVMADGTNNNPWYGDYMHGAGYVDATRANTANYVLVWPQETGLFARTIAVQDADALPAPPAPVAICDPLHGQIGGCLVKPKPTCAGTNACKPSLIPAFCPAGCVAPPNPFVMVSIEGLTLKDWTIGIVDQRTGRPMAAQRTRTSQTSMTLTFQPGPGRFVAGRPAQGYALKYAPVGDLRARLPLSVRVTSRLVGPPRVPAPDVDPTRGGRD